MTITDGEHLDRLLSLVHDRWFNVESLARDPRSNCVRFELEVNRSDLEHPSFERLAVVFKHVVDLEIIDTEKVRDYDIDTIVYNPATKVLLITGGVPIEIRMRVSDLEICVIS